MASTIIKINKKKSDRLLGESLRKRTYEAWSSQKEKISKNIAVKNYKSKNYKK